MHNLEFSLQNSAKIIQFEFKNSARFFQEKSRRKVLKKLAVSLVFLRTTKKHWRSAGFRRTSVQERQTEAKSFFNEVNLRKKTKLKSFLRIIFRAFQFGIPTRILPMPCCTQKRLFQALFSIIFEL